MGANRLLVMTVRVVSYLDFPELSCNKERDFLTG